MIPAQVLVSLVEAPGNGQAGNHAAEKVLGFVGTEDGGAGAIEIVLAAGLVEFQETTLPVLPMPDVIAAEFLVRFEQAGTDLLPGLGPDAAKTQRQHELSVACSEINFAGESDVSVFRTGVLPRHLEIIGEILPAVGEPDETRRPLQPGSSAAEGQGAIPMFGKEHCRALVVADPAGVLKSAVGKMGSEQRIQMVVSQRALQRAKANLLQHYMPIGIGDDFLFDLITALEFGVGELVGGNSRFDATF